MKKNKDILIVDDEELMRDFLYTALSDKYNVDTAENGKIGLEKIKSKNYDLVLTDIRMPEIDGITLLKECKKINKNTQVIVMTAYGTIEDAVEAMKMGAYDYLQKPFSADEIDLKINRVFEYQELVDTKDYLLSELQGKYGEKNIIAKSYKMRKIFETVKSYADSKATVLIQGESGTGKEMIAHAIHYNSPRKDKPFIKINCGALPENLLESELFGYEKGAFTGAFTSKKGKFELADEGTILLDEISEMPIYLQVKLLRVIQEREFDRVGGVKPIKVDVRIIATTNVDLTEAIKNKTFREDLFFRLNVLPINIPPLRERKEDIIALSLFFFEKYKKENNRPNLLLSKKALDYLCMYDWPGNVRELENFIERIIVMSDVDATTIPDEFFYDLKKEINLKDNNNLNSNITNNYIGMKLEDVEKDLILKTLELNEWNKTKAADILGITVRTLRNKLKIYEEEGIFIREDNSE